MEFLARNSWNLNTSCAGALLWWRIQLSGQSSGFSSEQIPVTLSALPNNAVDLPFVFVQWIRSELSSCDRRNTQAWSWPLTETCVLFSAEVNSVFSSACYQSSHKTWCLSAAPDSCHSFFCQPYTTDMYYFLCCSRVNESISLWLM